MDYNFDLMNNAKSADELRLAFLEITRDIFSGKIIDTERREQLRLESERILHENMKKYESN